MNAHRGPAHLLPQIQAELLSHGFEPGPSPLKSTDLGLTHGLTHEHARVQDIAKPKLPPLRPYQEAALCAWEIAGHRGLVVLPTGSGKTRLAAAAIHRVRRSTLVLVPTRVLLQQWASALTTFASESRLPIHVGIFGDGQRRISPLTIATFESAFRHMAWLGDHFELLIVDEAHHLGSTLRPETLEMSLAPFRLGLTATPPQESSWRDAAIPSLGPIVYELSLQELRGSVLADFDLIRVHVDLEPDERARYETEMDLFRTVNRAFRSLHPAGSWQDFAFYAARTEAGRRALKGLNAAKKLLHFPRAKRRTLDRILSQHQPMNDKVLVFTSDTATAIEISRAHLIMPITVDIQRQERDAALEWFRKGEISTLVSCQVLNEGFDVAEANVAVILGGVKGEREHLQRVGRILRWKDGRKARIYEIVCSRTLEMKQAERRGRSLDTGIHSRT